MLRMFLKILLELMIIKIEFFVMDKFDFIEVVNFGWCVIKLLVNLLKFYKLSFKVC